MAFGNMPVSSPEANSPVTEPQQSLEVDGQGSLGWVGTVEREGVCVLQALSRE